MSFHLFAQQPRHPRGKYLVRDIAFTLMYMVNRTRQEWDGAPGVSEQQLIRISDAVSGTFRLVLDGASTTYIPHNAAASRVASALEALPNVATPVEVGHSTVVRGGSNRFTRSRHMRRSVQQPAAAIFGHSGSDM